jgi:hypothetical protein
LCSKTSFCIELCSLNQTCFDHHLSITINVAKFQVIIDPIIFCPSSLFSISPLSLSLSLSLSLFIYLSSLLSLSLSLFLSVCLSVCLSLSLSFSLSLANYISVKVAIENRMRGLFILSESKLALDAIC